MSNPIKSTDMIRLSDGTVGQLGEFLDNGKLVLSAPTKFYSKRAEDGWRWAYFAEEVGTEDEDGDRDSWEIRKTLWQSRRGEHVDVSDYS